MAKQLAKPQSLAQACEREQRKQKEKAVQDGTIKFMRAHGWRVFRMNSGLFPGARGFVRVGEPGMADLLCVRYIRNQAMTRQFGSAPGTGVAYLVWIECKRAKGGKTAEHQAQWHLAEEERGGVLYTCSDLEDLREWYFRRFGFLHAREGQLDMFEVAKAKGATA